LPSQATQFEQAALVLDGGTHRVENLTITGCDSLRYLIKVGDYSTTATIHNATVAGNGAWPLVYTSENSSLVWEYSLTPTLQPGVGNLVGDALFDPLLGPPFLAASSPCIDAGDPDPLFHDREDPANPGFPLWPAMGTLRNDMGFTGGPHAVPLDTSWVSVPMWQPSHRPRDFALGAPWPNPFNPVTHIPLTLERPLPVHISVYNLLGQEVAVLVNGILPAGTHRVPLQAGRLASGVYVVTLEVAGRQESRSVTLIR